MSSIYKISKRYQLRKFTAWFLCICIFFGPEITFADPNPPDNALPTGFNAYTSSGVIVNDPIGSTLTIDQTQSAAIANWNNFDIGANASVHFNQLSTDAVLNRVHDGSMTGIMGALSANGRVFIVNQAGIIFGEGAQINVAQLVASSLDIANDDFMNGIYDFAVPGTGEIINEGTINAAEGVSLFGKKVTNTGAIVTESGGFIVLAAGDKVVLGQPGSEIIVEMSSATGDAEDIGDVINDGDIEAPSGQIVLASGDIFSMGANIDTDPIKIHGGSGSVGQFGAIQTDGAIDDSISDGGSVTLTAAETVVLGVDSLTSANAGTNGDGGDIIAYSPGKTLFRPGALVEAKGGSEFGNGGFFEVSGKQYVEVLGDIDLTATNGKSGMFLIDPLNLWIVDDDTVDVVENPPSSNTWEPTDPCSVSQLDIDDLETYLGLGNVTLSTVGTIGPDDGDITFNADRYVMSGSDAKKNPVDSSLTVNSAHDIIFRAGNGIDFDGGGSITLTALDGSVIFENNYDTTPSNKIDYISTTTGGITISTGGGDIDIGNIITGSQNPHVSSGAIELYTDNQGKITTGYLNAFGGSEAIITAIASGDLEIYGDPSHGAVRATTHNTGPREGLTDEATSTICLQSLNGDVTIDGLIEAWAHGKNETYAEVHIHAGNDVYVNTQNGQIDAWANTAGKGQAEALVKIHAERVITSITNNSNNNSPPIRARANVSGIQPADVTSSGSEDAEEQKGEYDEENAEIEI